MDAHVLLSTIATAAAALVAIVGGLLVSRVISLASEQNGLAKRCDDLEADAAVAQARLAELDGRLLALEIQECLDEVREDHVRGRELDAAKVIAACAPTRTLDEIGPALQRQAERFAAIRAALTPAFAHGWTAQARDDYTDSQGISVEDAAADDWDDVWESLLEEHPEPAAPGPFGFASGVSFPAFADPAVTASHLQIRAMRSVAEQNAHAALVRDVDNARAGLRGLQAQINQTELALARVGRPAGVTGGLLVLAYVVISGVVVPLVLLTLDLTQLTRGAATAVFAAFVSGLVALMAYLWFEVRRLSRRPLRSHRV